jgi:hypothetical protein
MLRGALHLHTTYSDGELTLAELRAALRGAGCRFAFVTDHAEYFDEARVEGYRRECASRSDADFLLIPSLEFDCENRMHILGYGITSLIQSRQPERVIDEIRRRGGLAVIAHPRTEAFEEIERFGSLPDGIEVWNTKYDGKHAPRPATFELLGRLRARAPKTRAFYGVDLHWRYQSVPLLVDVYAELLTAEALLAALAKGMYEATTNELRLPSDGVIPADVAARFARVNARAQWWRQRMTSVVRLADRAGLKVPAVLKARLRRIF